MAGPAPRTAAGFSLLELLVVVVIIGILASMFTLSVGLTSGDRVLEREVDRLRALLTVASEDAVLQGRELGLRFHRGGYQFLALDPFEDRWRVLRDDPVLRSRQLDPDLRLALEIEGRDVELPDAEELAAADQRAAERAETLPPGSRDRGPQPQVFIFSSGDFSPSFALRLRREFGDLSLLLDVAADGEAEVIRERF